MANMGSVLPDDLTVVDWLPEALPTPRDRRSPEMVAADAELDEGARVDIVDLMLDLGAVLDAIDTHLQRSDEVVRCPMSDLCADRSWRRCSSEAQARLKVSPTGERTRRGRP